MQLAAGMFLHAADGLYDDEQFGGDQGSAPGKRALTASLAPRASVPVGAMMPFTEAGPPSVQALQARAAIEDVFSLHLLADGPARRPADPHAVAAAGMSGAPSSLPHLDTIQRAFGHHDVSGVPAFVGGAAGDASRALGAHAYAAGGGVAFGASPDLHTAAHEAAHVVQQRGGVQLKDGLGRAGDVYERHADAVADRVVAGQSAADLLDTFAGGSGPATGVQLLDDPAAAPAAAPAATPGTTPAPTDEAGWLAALSDAAAKGKEELWKVIDQAQATTAALLPKVGETALELVWPSGTGWKLTGDLQAAGFFGLGVGLELAGSGQASMMIMRTGPKVTFTITVAAGVGGAIEANLGLEGAVGVVPIHAASEVAIATDLGKVTWPPSILGALRAGDTSGALKSLMALGPAFWAVTEISYEANNASEIVAEAGVGSPAAAEAGLGGSVGVDTELKGEFTDGKQVEETTFYLEAGASVAAEVSPAVREAITELQRLHNILSFGIDMPESDPDSAAVRSGDLLPGPSDSGNSINVGGKLGLRIRHTIADVPTAPGTDANGAPVPVTNAPTTDTYEIGLVGAVSTELAVAGQRVGGELEVDVMYTDTDFLAIVKHAAAPLLHAAPKVAPTSIGITDTLTMTLADITSVGLLPGFDVNQLPFVHDDADKVIVTAELVGRFEWQTLIDEPVLADVLGGPSAEPSVDGVRQATRTVAAMPAGSATQQTFVRKILESCTVTFELANEHFADGQTPGFGEAPGAQGQGGVTTSNIYQLDLGPDAPELSVPTLLGILADLL